MTDSEEKKDDDKKSSSSFWDIMGDLFKMSVEDRIKHPIVGAIFITFILWNWQKIALIFFPTTSKSQMLIGDRIYDTSFFSLCSLGIPVLAGLLYAIAVPYLTWWYYRKIEKARIGIKSIKDTERAYKEVERLNTALSVVLEEKKNMTSIISQKETQLRAVRKQVSESELSIKQLSETITAIETLVSPDAVTPLLDISPHLIHSIIQRSKLSCRLGILEKSVTSYEHYFNSNMDESDYDPADQTDEHVIYANEKSEIEKIKQKLSQLPAKEQPNDQSA